VQEERQELEQQLQQLQVRVPSVLLLLCLQVSVLTPEPTHVTRHIITPPICHRVRWRSWLRSWQQSSSSWQAQWQQWQQQTRA
jgi:hypothetical protein